MKNKIVLLMIIPALASCTTGTKSLFKDAFDMGSMGEDMITYNQNNAKMNQTDYYKFTVSKKIIFNAEEYDMLSIVAYDTHEAYENFSMPITLKLYDSSFKEITTISYRDFMSKYDGEDFSGMDPTFGTSGLAVEKDIEPGDYYFSITPKENPYENHYLVWVAPYLGD